MPRGIASPLLLLAAPPGAVTAAHNDAKSAMVASWVAQASFEPLGLTIAVAKDRAIESLMQVHAAALPYRMRVCRARSHAWARLRPCLPAACQAWRRPLPRCERCLCWNAACVHPLYRCAFRACSALLGPCQACLLARCLPPAPQVGDKFVLNCLGEGEYNATIKHFLQVRTPAPAATATAHLHARLPCKV